MNEKNNKKREKERDEFSVTIEKRVRKKGEETLK